MKIGIFSINTFDRPFFEKIKNSNHELVYFQEQLNKVTAYLAKGFDAIAIFTSDTANEEVLRLLHSYGIKYIALRSVGYDHVDMQIAKELKIKIANVPEYSPFAIAEHAIAMILALNRKLIIADNRVKRHDFSLESLTGFDLNGKTVGIIGIGKIGSVLVKILHGFGCKILGYDKLEDRFLKSNYGLHYTSLEELCQQSDIISLRKGCTNLDSLWALRYIHSSNEILFEIGSNVSNYYSVKKSVSKEVCWHRFTLLKFGLTYLVYIDNQLISNILARENIVFSRNARMSVGDSPCNIVNNVRRFKGVVDEITLYNRALSDLELKSIYKYPDQIVTPNSTIFKGQTIQLEVGESCSNRVNWSPGSSLDASDELDPIASPQKTTTYTVTLDNGTCISKDSVTIFVADKDKLDCDKLLLPKAFTPNNDGLNETFGISNVFIIDQMESFEIFDRWGAKVWETTQLEEKWDGTFKGQLLSNGMYLYKIKYTCGGEQKININNFNLLR